MAEDKATKTRRVRIKSDGTPSGCTVTDLDSGAVLSCTRVEFSQEWGANTQAARAKLTVMMPQLEFEGLADLELDPYLREVYDAASS